MKDAMVTGGGEPRPLVPSDEGDHEGLALGRAQGEALTRTIEHMRNDIAHDGREMQAGEYLVVYAVEEAEGIWMPKPGGAGGGDLEWVEPDAENCHVEVAVRDAADGRLTPTLMVRAAILDGVGNEVESKVLPLLWHPYLYHYGANFTVPGSGTYALRVSFDAPDFPRHDQKNGRRFLEGCTVTFDNVKIQAGQD